MSIMHTIRTGLGAAFANTSRAATVAATATAAGAAEGIRMAPGFVIAAAPKVGAQILKNIAFNIVLLECIDAGEAFYTNHKRKKKIRRIQDDIVNLGPTDGTFFKKELYEALVEELEKLNRARERRSFVQFVKDLPHRTWRRVWRATLLEAGWWTMLLTSPVWVPVGAATLLWYLGVGTYDAVSEVMGNAKDRTETYQKFNKPVQWVFAHTFFVGMNIFVKGATMRVYDQKIYTSETTFEVFDVAKDASFVEVPEVKDGHTAHAFGGKLAEAINEFVKDTGDRQAAYAQSFYWTKQNFAPNYHVAVMKGFREHTPFLYRDLVMA